VSDRSELERVYARAVAMLAARARSSRDLRARLVQKGEPPALVDLAIARLIEQRYLDDAAYASARARSALARGRSTRRAVMELEHRGIDRASAREALTGAMADRGEDETAVCERAARKKLRSLEGEAPQDRRRKLHGFLARQGFGADAVRRVLSRVLTTTEASENVPCEDDGA
jgi:regulatory protein